MPHRNEFIPEKLDLVTREEVAKHLNHSMHAFDEAILFFLASAMANHLKKQSTESRVVQTGYRVSASQSGSLHRNVQVPTTTKFLSKIHQR